MTLRARTHLRAHTHAHTHTHTHMHMHMHTCTAHAHLDRSCHVPVRARQHPRVSSFQAGHRQNLINKLFASVRTSHFASGTPSTRIDISLRFLALAH